MPTRRQRPVTYLAEGSAYPDGPFRWGTPWEVFLAAALAARLKDSIGDESIRYIGKISGLHPQTILNILNGKTWPDLRTIARLERSLRTRLWGTEHRSRNYPISPNDHIDQP